MNPTEVARRIRRAVGISAMAFAICSPGFGQDVANPASVNAFDPREVALLPKYCMYTQLFRLHVPGGGDNQQIEAWRALMGPTFEDMHHYCFGLMKTNRATLYGLSREQRRFYLSDAVDEFDYVLQRAQKDFVLLPEILVKKGMNLVRLDKGPVAILQFERAIEAKPDYWTAYGELSDFYKQQGNIARAREVLERGLAASPDAPGLKRRMTELTAASDGKKVRRSSDSSPAVTQR